MTTDLFQDKKKETDFFDEVAHREGQYNVFTDAGNMRIVRACVAFGGLKPGNSVADLGCGTGVFTRILHDFGFHSKGLDMSDGLIRLARRDNPEIEFVVGDVEKMPFDSESLDGVFLSGILHHLPDPSTCAREVRRVLKPGGVFVAFDPNRKNPFMWLYRDRTSPFYSSNGVTPNERPIIASEIAQTFRETGFEVAIHYLSGIGYRIIASRFLRVFLPLYNALDYFLFQPPFLRRFSSFIILSGVKT